ncbi:MAG: tRNA (N(6)-L-threonylcarbamoyladenosine(37)-C(2))-methylthiotransferase MtaB [Bacteroidota bacterium]|nr:tRNA (N(6)-L-threonylcarbamoyladenosine(37)-C(2))-methylthiotransferase MtaB [Candidatus Kapabacteria bacterium]MCS7302122.1 tRNA (N(6)-L-threonylcarbamoyladenosine(37)-C(2))-methylthiotransferase MtaB [Candidatus Kapabacteria bacterium]MCX7936486.1 tRNA (N(6)-L-threonylcarbamoyladenosine(37)-C(2))-methylthiotransferase MtaB [Chlorobiota bacterium]MDW8074647.1 tRNA (N(6)-L-threonylcarbamoyladenosine(37)-C(2))-methylthiotransferase MtaB [Bacteroidota bacterium]MDW8270877.1 tRNA (N(6)-L-threon
MKAAIYTFGCKQNYAESSSLARSLEERGYTIVPFGEPADVIVLNTCSVTESADRECRKILNRARRIAPHARIVVTGCYAQLQPYEIASFDGVDIVIGNSEKNTLADVLSEALSRNEYPFVVHAGDIRTQQLEFVPAVFSEHDSRTRAFLKLQDGCDYSCSFCTIPRARGKSRSMNFSEIEHHVRRLTEAGYREIVLTGINLGEYRAPTGERLIDVLRLLVSLRLDCRYRLSSVEPNRMHPEMIDFIAEHPTICPHFHLPLQSGSPAVLRAMRRRYKRELYAERVLYIKQRIPSACIGADVLVGFPGESEADFAETYRFIEQLPLSYLHVFTYSERERTEAAQRSDQVPYRIRKERTRRLRELGEQKKAAFYRENINTYRKVLVESYDEGVGGFVGYTENYCRVVLPAAPQGEIVEVLVDGIAGQYLLARVRSEVQTEPRYFALPILA